MANGRVLIFLLLVVGPLPGAAQPGSLDASFNTTNGPMRWTENPVESAVWSVLRLRNGQVLVGGPFEQVEGLDWRHLARLNPDGSLDRTFTAWPNRPVRAMVEQPDGRIVIAGEFNGVNNQFRDRVARLEPDGSLDTNFTVRLGLNGIMHAVALQPDGKVIVGGAFHVARSDAPWIHNIIRLETNGLIDFTFDPGTNLFATDITRNFVRTVAVLSDGKIMAGGSFHRAARSSRDYLARLLPGGAVDPTFSVEQPLSGPNGPVHTMAAQAGGLLVIGGSFTNVHGAGRTNLARLLPDGSLDETFRPQAILGSGLVNALAVDNGGRVLAVHSGSEYNWNYTASRVFRFDASGRIDSNQLSGFVFRAGGPAGISTLAPHPDGGLYIGGNFDVIDGVTRRRAALLLGDPPGPPVFTLPPTNVTSDSGLDVMLQGCATVSAPTFCQWFRNGEPVPDATNILLLLRYVMPPDGGDFQLVVSNAFGAVTSGVATLTVRDPMRPGAVDLSFAPTVGADSNIVALAEGESGSVYVGGSFSRYERINANVLVRVNRSGILDTNFMPLFDRVGYPNWLSIRALRVRNDGTILTAGFFYRVNGQPANHLISLRSDGRIDPGFDFTGDMHVESFVPFNALAVDEQDRILAGGFFASLNSNFDQRFLVRLRRDGSHDLSFKFGNRLNQQVYAIATDEHDRILTGGAALFSGPVGPPWDLMRLNRLGSLDVSFAFGGSRSCVGGGSVGGSDCGVVNSILVQPDGKIIAGGDFSGGYFQSLSCSSCQHTQRNLVRLNPDGTFDPDFNSRVADIGPVSTMARQADGKLMIAGRFTSIGGVPRNGIARLNLDGSVDPSWDAANAPVGGVSAMLIRSDGKIVVAGRFTRFNGHQRGSIAVLHGGPVEAPAVISPPESHAIVAGQPLKFAPLIAGYPPPALQWLRNGVPIDGATQAVLRLPNARVADSGVYSLMASNAPSVSTSLVATVSVEPPPIQAGVIDPIFSTGLGADGEVNVIAVQSDGRILIGGQFMAVNGRPRAGIARLQADGALDTSFDPGAALSEMPSNNIYISRIVLQPDGRVVVGGSFNRFNGVARRGVVRLNPDGTVDESLPDVGGWPLLAQADGKLLVGGNASLRRLHPDGTEDTAFVVSSNAYGSAYAASMQADGRILLVGAFSRRVARLMPDGSADVSFAASELSFDSGPVNDICFPDPQGAGPSALVHALCLQSDGGILVGGVFRKYPSRDQWNLIRILPTGRWDTNFNQRGGPNFAVRAIAVQLDGKILIGGCFTNLGYFPNQPARQHLARLNPDGSVDPSFNPGAGFRGTGDGYVRALALLPDGRILIGGQFDTVDTVRRNNLARLTGDVILFEIASEGPAFTTRVATTEGRMYWLETRESAADGDWSVVDSTAGDGGDQTLTHTSADGTQRFYRVRVE